jgi:hypothetical protein
MPAPGTVVHRYPSITSWNWRCYRPHRGWPSAALSSDRSAIKTIRDSETIWPRLIGGDFVAAGEYQCSVIADDGPPACRSNHTVTDIDRCTGVFSEVFDDGSACFIAGVRVNPYPHTHRHLAIALWSLAIAGSRPAANRHGDRTLSPISCPSVQPPSTISSRVTHRICMSGPRRRQEPPDMPRQGHPC